MLPGWLKNPQPYSIDDVRTYLSNLDESERGESLTFQSLKPDIDLSLQGTVVHNFIEGRQPSIF